MDEKQQNPASTQPVNPGGEVNAPASHVSTPPKKSRKLLIAIVVLFFVALAIVTVFVIRGDEGQSNTSNPASSSTAKPARSSDVEQTAKEIEETLQKADGINDVTSADLSDSSLGL